MSYKINKTQNGKFCIKYNSYSLQINDITEFREARYDYQTNILIVRLEKNLWSAFYKDNLIICNHLPEKYKSQNQDYIFNTAFFCGKGIKFTKKKQEVMFFYNNHWLSIGGEYVFHDIKENTVGWLSVATRANKKYDLKYNENERLYEIA